MRYNILIARTIINPEEREEMFMAFLASFLQYFIIMVILAAVAAAGVFVGKKLRDNKDAKKTASNDVE